MNKQLKQNEVENKIINLREQEVILDRDVASLYGVETKDINKAVKNNPDKFLKGYIIQLIKQEKLELVKNFHRFEPLKHSTVLPKAFTEKGLYMLATILKSKKATETTLSIIETFARVKEIARAVREIPLEEENSSEQQALLDKTGELISDLIMPKQAEKAETEASIELNFAVVKLKYSVKKNSK
jgi:hypothetical protein